MNAPSLRRWPERITNLRDKKIHGKQGFHWSQGGMEEWVRLVG
jgi:hypothetical protein